MSFTDPTEDIGVTGDDYLAAAVNELPNVQPTSENLVVLNALLAIAHYMKTLTERP